MSQVKLLEAFKQNIILLKAMGLWRFESEPFYKFFKLFVQSSLLFDSMSMITYVAVNMKVNKITDTVFSLPGSLEVVLQSVLFRKNFHKIKKTLDNLAQLEFQPRNEAQEKILTDSILLSKKVFYSFFALVGLMISVWMMLPVTKEGKFLPTKYWIPFDYRRPVVYELLYTFECSCIILHGFSNVALDTFFAITMIQIGAQCEILCDSIKNVHTLAKVRDEEESTDDDFKRMDTVFLECVHHYNLIVEYVKFVSESFKEILMVQFVCSSLMLLSVYELSLSVPMSGHFFQVLLFQIAAINEIFLYCWFANEVIIKSEKLYYAMFELRWYDSSSALKKNLIIFGYQVRKPICLYVWNIIPVDIKTFTGLLQKVWSLFVAMKNTEDIRSN